jgi:hypothetical protein
LLYNSFTEEKEALIVMSLGNKLVMSENIKRLMNEKGVNASMICADLNIPMATFSDWCHAKTYPRIDKIEMLANYFCVAKSELVEAHEDRITDVDILQFKKAQNTKSYNIPINLDTLILNMRAADLTNEELSRFSNVSLERIEAIISDTGMASFDELLKLKPYVGDIVDHPYNIEIAGYQRDKIVKAALNPERFSDIENTIIQKYRSSDDLTKAMVRRTLGIDTREIRPEKIVAQELEEPDLDLDDR